MYKPGSKSHWNGRQDSGSTHDLWHQIVTPVDLNLGISSGVSFLGFCSDIGVKRNLGRPGAVDGPDAIRGAMSNLANHRGASLQLQDGGDVVVSGDQLEAAQQELARYTAGLLDKGAFPILMGGGHEISYAHGKGVLTAFPDERIGMINIDPHFDLRVYPKGAHSGSWARQLFDEFEQFSYLPIGIDPAVNIASMFDLMSEKQQGYLSMQELHSEPSVELIQKIHYFADSVDRICLTLDLDVFSSGIAPGVSAINPSGALAYQVRPLIKAISKMEKLVSFDVAEMNPSFDDGRTAKLAASMIYLIVEEQVSE